MKKTFRTFLIISLFIPLVGCVELNDAITTIENDVKSLFNKEQKADLEKELAESSGTAKVDVDDHGVLTTTFDSDMTFAKNSADLQPAVKDTIRTVATVLKKYPESTVRVFGHTDKTGSAEYNMSLSIKRAESVKQELIKHGFTGEIIIVGFGETKPLMKDKLSLDRRVEIKINDVVPLAVIQDIIAARQKQLINAENEKRLAKPKQIIKPQAQATKKTVIEIPPPIKMPSVMRQPLEPPKKISKSEPEQEEPDTSSKPVPVPEPEKEPETETTPAAPAVKKELDLDGF